MRIENQLSIGDGMGTWRAPCRYPQVWRTKCQLSSCVWYVTTALIIPMWLSAATHAQPSALNRSDAPLVIDGTATGDVFGFGRSVEVRGEVQRGVLVVGGDAIVEGRVAGDVATIGGSVVQRPNSFVGGDVIVLGGTYTHADGAPGRNPHSTTLMYAGYEAELRRLARDPALLLVPSITPQYVGTRLLAVLFWFVLALALNVIAPNVVSRAGERLRPTNPRVAVIGFVSLIAFVCGVSLSLGFLPQVISTIVGIAALIAITIAYLFGRVVIHLKTGQWLQRISFPASGRSPSVALLLGTFFWVTILSLPYVWALAIGGLLVVSFGLALTERASNDAKRKRTKIWEPER